MAWQIASLLSNVNEAAISAQANFGIAKVKRSGRSQNRCLMQGKGGNR